MSHDFDAAGGRGRPRRADDADPEADVPTSMADLYPYLSPEQRAEYDEARRQLLHTLDRMPRNGQEAWVGELRLDLDEEDLLIRRWIRDATRPDG